MVTSSSPAEVAVIGGGPAGATAARLLSLWGHRVTLITRPSQIGGLAESIPPSSRKLFDRLGITDAIERANFIRTMGNRVWWGDEERVVEFPDHTHGWQVVREDFDQLLLHLAIDAGVTIGTDADGAAWTLDCSGRSGVIARHGYRTQESGLRTLALAATWECAVDANAHTLVESYANGWAWSVPGSATTRCIAVMIEPGLVKTLKGGQKDSKSEIARLYQNEIAKTKQMDAITLASRQLTQPWACDASSYTARRFSDDGILLVGDAASFVDPLSSFGIKKALASAWLAAVVVHTALTEPELKAQALQFYEARERSMYESLQRQSAAFADRASGQHRHDFWLERASFDVEEPRSNDDIKAAFEDLKQREAIVLSPNPALQRLELPVVRGNRIGLATHLVNASYPEGIRYVHDVDLLKLIDQAPEHVQVPDLYEAYNRSAPPVALQEFLAALSLSIARGLLQHA